MEIGLYAESAGLPSLAETLPRARDLGITRIELSTGGQSSEPFLDVDALLESKSERRALLDSIADHGMSISALNVSAFPLHPRLGAAHVELTRKTMRLAGELGVDRVIAQSGAPGDAPGSSVPNWIAYPWPEDMRATVRCQWEEGIALWRDLAEYGKGHGVTRICFELHPVNLVYNVPTLMTMREAAGDTIGANFDPSHLMWQGMDIPACVRAIGPAIFHVHIKDVMMHRHNQALVGVLDNRPDANFHDRPWNFCTPGFGHDARWWRDFFVALRDADYDDVASIENEDPYLPGIAGVERTVPFLREVIKPVATGASMRIGLIGCGNVGVNAHIPAVQASEGMSIVAAADPTLERLQAAAGVAGLGSDDLHADWRDLIARDDVAAVIVATPQRFRPEIVMAAAGAGKHVLAEKPLALTPAAARAMIDAAQASGVTLATVHNYHFMPVYRAIKEVLDSGEIGQPEIAVLNYLGVEDRPGAAAYSPRWRHRAADSGGGVLMDMLHVVYLASWFMGGPPLAVSAWVDRRLEGDGDVEDIALVRYVYPSGQALLNMAWGVGPGGVEIGGRRGRLVMTNTNFGTHPFVPAARLDVVAESGSRSWTPREAVAYGMAGVAADFRDAVAAGVEPVASGESGLRVLDAVLGAYVSGALGDEVALPLPDDHPVYAKGSAGIADLDLPDRSPVLQRGLFGVNRAPASVSASMGKEVFPRLK